MEGKVLEAAKVADLNNAAEHLISYCNSRKIFAIYGEMGVGKTTFVKEICRQLGSEDAFSSPTFSIVNEYRAGAPIYHIDLYRLRDKAEALDIGLEEYLYSGNYCFIEWPELVEDMLPEDAVKIYMSADAEQMRKIRIVK